MTRFERKHEPLLDNAAFALRLAWFAAFAFGILLLSLYMGMAGFHYLERISWIDSLLNAAMLLGGMGPVTTPVTDPGKYFASFYAIYSGVVFLLAFGVLVAPVAHRFFHHFHLPDDQDLGIEPSEGLAQAHGARKKAAKRGKK